MTTDPIMRLLLIVFICTSSIVIGEDLLCTPSELWIEDDHNNILMLNDNNFRLTYDRSGLAVYEYPDTRSVNVLVNDTSISFTGFLVNHSFSPAKKHIKDYKFKTRLAGVARLARNYLTGEYALTDCELYTSRSKKEQEDIPLQLKVELLHQASACLRKFWCEKVGRITANDLKNGVKNPFHFGAISVTLRKEKMPDFDWDEHGKEFSKVVSEIGKRGDFISSGPIQSTINILLDIAIAELAKMMEIENEGYVEIPDIDSLFSTGSSFWQTNGKLSATNGSFGDLTTLKRTEDAVLSHSKLKFTASCGIGLNKAEMAYQNYKLKYGVIGVSGKISAIINGTAMNAKISVDYNQLPCKTSLDEFKITEMGKMKVAMTGLGPLNKLTSKLASWITKKWKEEILSIIEENIKQIIVKHLSQFSCERFRP